MFWWFVLIKYFVVLCYKKKKFGALHESNNAFITGVNLHSSFTTDLDVRNPAPRFSLTAGVFVGLICQLRTKTQQRQSVTLVDGVLAFVLQIWLQDLTEFPHFRVLIKVTLQFSAGVHELRCQWVAEHLSGCSAAVKNCVKMKWASMILALL